MSSNIFKVGLSIIALLGLGQCLTPEQIAEIENVVGNEFIQFNQIPGMGLTIVEDNGATVFSRGYGLMDVERVVPATNNTKFAIASITKTFTATLVVKVLSERFPQFGAAVLEMPIKQLHPTGNFTFSDRFRSEAMSFRDLLSHRHGLETEALAMGAGAYQDMEENTYRTRYAQESYAFRTFGVYSNGMYALVGKLVGEIAGQSYESLLENLFSDIGMTDSTYFKQSEDYDTLPNMSRGYYMKDEEWTKSYSELWKRIHVAIPAGGIITTASDMAKYISFHLNLGNVGGRQIISQEAMQWLQQTSLSIVSMSFKESEGDLSSGMYAIGTGFSLGAYDGWAYWEHSGQWNPFTSLMRIYPGLKFGTFSVVNGPRVLYESPFSHQYLNEEILRIANDLPASTAEQKPHPTPKNKPNAISSPKNTNSVMSAKQLDPSALVGIYGHPVEGEMEILQVDDHPNGTLYMRYGKWATAFLISINNSTNFQLSWDSEMVEDFYFNIGTIDEETVLEYVPDTDPMVDSFRLTFGPTSYLFTRNVTLESLPETPWGEGSCGPGTLV